MTQTDLSLKAAVLGILRQHRGKANAIRGKEMARMLGFRNDRAIRLVIEELENEVPVAATTEPPYGYFIAETNEEKLEYLEVLKSRSIHNWERWHRFQRSAGLKLAQAAQGKLI